METKDTSDVNLRYHYLLGKASLSSKRKTFVESKLSYEVCDAALHAMVCSRGMLRSLFFLAVRLIHCFVLGEDTRSAIDHRKKKMQPIAVKHTQSATLKLLRSCPFQLLGNFKNYFPTGLFTSSIRQEYQQKNFSLVMPGFLEKQYLQGLIPQTQGRFGFRIINYL